MLHSKRKTLEWPDLNVLFSTIMRFAEKKDTATLEEIQNDFDVSHQVRNQRSKVGTLRKGSVQVQQFRSHSEARMAEFIDSRADLGVQRSASAEVIDKTNVLNAVEPAHVEIIDLNDDSEDQEVAA